MLAALLTLISFYQLIIRWFGPYFGLMGQQMNEMNPNHQREIGDDNPDDGDKDQMDIDTPSVGDKDQMDIDTPSVGDKDQMYIDTPSVGDKDQMDIDTSSVSDKDQMDIDTSSVPSVGDDLMNIQDRMDIDQNLSDRDVDLMDIPEQHDQQE
ncbi:hypothetical protein V6N13_035539 [Hibiscus sabdariffa]|uniref:Uncharacterized protein n=1 Tax=Hibiscus sabdariffa TaxID=183260 RepID=A0ABR2S924_9ROSI